MDLTTSVMLHLNAEWNAVSGNCAEAAVGKEGVEAE